MDDPPLPPTVADCLLDLAAGDDSARARILELCSERLRLLAHRMLNRFPAVRRWEDTDDVFQNAALRLYRCLGEVSIESPRELIDLARHHSGPMAFGGNHATGVLPLEDESNSRHPAATPADAGTSVDRWSLFHEAIAQLPAEQREVFQLVWYLGADQQSIANLLGCSVRTVKSRWREAREGVKAALGDQAPE
jgi:DNA-directed RNA polymerase specialized sigma24 family protein